MFLFLVAFAASQRPDMVSLGDTYACLAVFVLFDLFKKDGKCTPCQSICILHWSWTVQLDSATKRTLENVCFSRSKMVFAS